MDRVALQIMAQAKLDDAELLFAHGRFSNSYYLFGYAAELAIKARIAPLFRADTIPDRKLVLDVYSHDLNKLIGVAGLTDELLVDLKKSQRFADNWSTVSSWTEASRYAIVDPNSSAEMRTAMMNAEEGVFRWLRARW